MSDQEELKQSLDIDYMKLLFEDDSVSIVECFVLHEGVNRNKCNIPHDVIVNALPSLANKPIWGIPNSKFMRSSSTDFVEHARSPEQTEDIMIFGVFPESGVKNAEFVEMNGKIYLKVQAILFKIYAPIAMSILENRDGNTKISIEINVKGKQNEQGILDVGVMSFLSATALGIKVLEGIENSQLDIIRFSMDEAIKESNTHYLVFSEREDKYKIPDQIKENVKQGLQFKKQFGRGGTSLIVKNAKSIAESDYVTYKQIQTYLDFSTKYQHYNFNQDNPDNASISSLLCGGKEGFSWFEDIIKNKNKEGEKLENSTEVFVKKEDLGSKEAIKINKGKDAMSDSAWGDEDKSELKKDCLMASNWEEVCKAVFQKLEEGWKDGKEGSLGYPVMEKKSDEVVYNRHALSSAKTYAEKNNEEEVLSELKSIYKHLDLSWNGEEVKNSEVEGGETVKNAESVEKFGLNSSQIIEILNNALIEYQYGNSWRKYWATAFDEEYAYINDWEDDTTYRAKYIIEDNIAKIDMSEKEQVIRGGYEVVGAIPAVVVNTQKPDDESNEDEMMEMKNKYIELEQKFSTMENELKMAQEKVLEFEKKDELEKMSALVEEFSHCFSEDEMMEMKNKMTTLTYAEIDTEVSNKAKEFARKAKVDPNEKNEDSEEEKNETPAEEKEEDTVVKNTLQFSVSPFGVISTYDFSKNFGEGGLDSIIKNSGVKIK